MEHKKKAWIVTGVLLFILFTWALIAVHDSAVAAAKAARANKTENAAGCPFSKATSTSTQPEPKKESPCCQSKASKKSEANEENGSMTSTKAANETSKGKFEKFADLDEAELEEFLKQFSPEELAKCPHLKARKTNKKK